MIILKVIIVKVLQFFGEGEYCLFILKIDYFLVKFLICVIFIVIINIYIEVVNVFGMRNLKTKLKEWNFKDKKLFGYFSMFQRRVGDGFFFQVEVIVWFLF